MKLNQLQEANYAGKRSLQTLLRYFEPGNLDEVGIPGEEDAYGVYYKVRDQYLAKYGDPWEALEIVGISILDAAETLERNGDVIHVFGVHDDAEGVSEKNLIDNIEIFNKPKRIF